jgi:hypothetical protein
LFEVNAVLSFAFDATLKDIVQHHPLEYARAFGLPTDPPRISDRLRKEASPADAAQLITASFVLAGLRFEKAVTEHLFRGVGIVEESYQWILEQGEIKNARKVVIRLGTQRFGPPDEKTENAIEDLGRLSRMTDAILMVKTWKRLLATQ